LPPSFPANVGKKTRLVLLAVAVGLIFGFGATFGLDLHGHSQVHRVQHRDARLLPATEVTVVEKPP
jgi:hypothetical protein